MSTVGLSQLEADKLLAMEKRRASDDPIRFPHPRRKARARLQSVDGKEAFLLDMYFGDVDFPRFSIQLRARQIDILARLELDGPAHENPDGFLVPTPHLHVFREGEGVKWAYGLPAHEFADLSDRWVVWQDFMRFCNITIPPRIQRDFFL